MLSTTLSAASPTRDNLRATSILDYSSAPVQAIVNRLKGDCASAINYLQSAHSVLRDEVRPVYTIDELQPVSVTLGKGVGSCSQRFACLEALARANGIATRVRALWIAGRFWAPRFVLSRPFIPRRILLAWPQFYVDDTWLSVESLFGSVQFLAQQNGGAFTNDAESLFDAIDHTPIDFTGQTARCGDGRCDLSGFVVGDEGLFSSRDELFSSLPLLQRSMRGRAFEFIYGGRKSN